MNWFKTAYSISTKEPNSYYTVVSPIHFYECRYSGLVPKGTKCSTLLPPSDIIVYDKDQLIASIVVQPDQIEHKNNQLFLNEDVQTPIILKVGQLQTCTELLERFKCLLKEFNRKFANFKTTVAYQQYIISQQKEPKLYRLVPQNDKFVTIESFGAIKDIMSSIVELKDILSGKAQTKEGRAYELYDLRKVEHIYTYINNIGIPIDPTRFQLLVRESHIKPLRTNRLGWHDCYLELTPEAKDMYDKINHFESTNWVKAILSAKN